MNNSSLILLALFSSLIGTIVCISIPLSSSHYQRLIGDRCFNETYDRRPLRLGQNNPVGMSIENLISLIEKVERKLPDLTAQQVIVMILRRFHIDGLQSVYGSNTQSPIEMNHRKVTDQIILTSTLPTTPEFPEDSLTEDEKCALFYTMSHTVNETATHDEDRANTWERVIPVGRAPTAPVTQAVKAKLNTSQPVQSNFLSNQLNSSRPVPQPLPPLPPPEQPSASEVKSADGDETKSEEDEDERRKRQTDLSQSSGNRAPGFSQHSTAQILTKNPREKGVASYRNNRDEAIAVNRVLLGTAVGLLNTVARSIRDITKALASDFDDQIVDGQLDPLFAVTLSDLLAIDGGYGLTNPVGQLKFGARGQWNSTACQTSYRLEVNGTLATLAELRGGIDGWNIGRKVNAIVSRNNRLSLSQILRAYYSNRGLTADSAYCRRGYEVNNAFNEKVVSEAKNYLRVWNWVQHGGRHDDSKLTGYVEQTKGQFITHMQTAATQRPANNDDVDFCNSPTSIDIKQSPCESQADVFFMLDNMSGGDANAEQIEVITQVVRTLDLRRSGGSVTVLVNSDGQSNLVDDNNFPITTALYALAYNTTSSQCASCRSAWYDNRQMPISDRPRLLELINHTLRDYEANRASQSGVPSKSFVWFDFDNLKPIPTDQTGKRKYEDFKWRLRYEHRDVPFFMATLNKDNVKDLLRRDDDWISLGSGVDNARRQAQELAKKICKTPQTFQHTECRQRKSDNLVYEGFITPGYKQYWSMYPEFFIKSYSIEFVFKADGARLKVCFDRFLEPELQDRYCREATDDSGEVKFTVSNPCHRKTFENCEPFFFTLALSTQTTTLTPECADSRCKTLDQVKWTFRHTGIACSSSQFLTANYYFHIACSFALILTIFRNKS